LRHDIAGGGGRRGRPPSEALPSPGDPIIGRKRRWRRAQGGSFLPSLLFPSRSGATPNRFASFRPEETIPPPPPPTAAVPALKSFPPDAQSSDGKEAKGRLVFELRRISPSFAPRTHTFSLETKEGESNWRRSQLPPSLPHPKGDLLAMKSDGGEAGREERGRAPKYFWVSSGGQSESCFAPKDSLRSDVVVVDRPFSFRESRRESLLPIYPGISFFLSLSPPPPRRGQSSKGFLPPSVALLTCLKRVCRQPEEKAKQPFRLPLRRRLSQENCCH